MFRKIRYIFDRRPPLAPRALKGEALEGTAVAIYERVKMLEKVVAKEPSPSLWMFPENRRAVEAAFLLEVEGK